MFMLTIRMRNKGEIRDFDIIMAALSTSLTYDLMEFTQAAASKIY